MKKCTKCNEQKEISDFFRDKSKKDGYYPACKQCILAWRSANYIRLRDAQNVARREDYKSNKSKYKARRRAYYARTASVSKLKTRLWQLANPDKVKESAKRRRAREATIPSKVIDHRMSTALYLALKGRKSGRNWETILGYTTTDLYTHLESRFLPGMSWDNMGEWHIDHIVPKAFFEYTSLTDQEFLYCWSLDNLRPLWGHDNFAKGARLPVPAAEQYNFI